MTTQPNFIVVDDDSSNNFICKLSIRRVAPEAELIPFTEAESALEYINKNYTTDERKKSTILFLDINMPTMSGWDFLTIFANLDARITAQFTIYILSSSIDQRDKEKASTNPYVCGFFSKPLSEEIIAEVLASVKA